MPSQVTERLQEGPATEVLEHLYWPRLQAEFVSTFPYMTAINKAHVLMLARQEILQPEAARQLLQAVVALEGEGAEAFQLDPRLEDAFFNYEAAVIRRTGPEIGGQMHTGRSRNDVSATLLRLQLRDRLLDLLPLFFTLRRTALAQAERYAEVIMPGYTHLQPAQPVTFGHYLTGIAAALARDTQRLAAVYPRVNQSPLGAAALAGTTFPLDRAYMAVLLGFDGLVEHTLDAVASRDCAGRMLGAGGHFRADLQPYRAGFARLVFARISEHRFARPGGRHVQHHAAKEKPGGARALKGQAGAPAGGFCGGGHGDQKRLVHQHH